MGFLPRGRGLVDGTKAVLLGWWDVADLGVEPRQERTIATDNPIDPATAKALAADRRFQAEERMAAGPEWIDMGLVVTSKTGNRAAPSNFDQTLARLVKQAGVPRLTSHGLRHTAATHMVRHAADCRDARRCRTSLGTAPTC